MKIGVIGFGNLGKALVKGLIYKNVALKDDIYVCANTEKTLKNAEAEYGVNALSDINSVISKTEIVFFVVKEGVFHEIANHIDTKILENKIVVSLMAGVKISKIQNALKLQIPVIRAMPTVSIENGNGVIGYTQIDQSQSVVEEMLKALGLAIEIDENNIEKITAISACGLGFAAYILDAFVSAGVELGLDSEISKAIIAKVFDAAIESADYKNLIHTVATKGGATEKGLEHFCENNLNGIIGKAVQKAYGSVSRVSFKEGQ